MELSDRRAARERRPNAGSKLAELLQDGLDSEEERALQALDDSSDTSFTPSSDEEAVDEIESDFSAEEVEGTLEGEAVESEASIRREERKERQQTKQRTQQRLNRFSQAAALDAAAARRRRAHHSPRSRDSSERGGSERKPSHDAKGKKRHRSGEESSWAVRAERTARSTSVSSSASSSSSSGSGETDSDGASTVSSSERTSEGRRRHHHHSRHGKPRNRGAASSPKEEEEEEEAEVELRRLVRHRPPPSIDLHTRLAEAYERAKETRLASASAAALAVEGAAALPLFARDVHGGRNYNVGKTPRQTSKRAKNAVAGSLWSYDGSRSAAQQPLTGEKGVMASERGDTPVWPTAAADRRVYLYAGTTPQHVCIHSSQRALETYAVSTVVSFSQELPPVLLSHTSALSAHRSPVGATPTT